MSFFAALFSRLIGLVLRAVGRDIKKEVDEAIDHHVAQNDLQNLQKAQTDGEKSQALTKIADDSFGSNDGKL